MSRDFIKITAIANLTDTPELNKLPSGDSVANFSIASSKNDNQANYLRCVAYKGTADIIGRLCQKGTRVYLEGRYNVKPWVDNHNQKRETVEFVISEINVLERGISLGNTEQQQQQQHQPDEYSGDFYSQK